MALTREKKEQIVSDIEMLLANSKLTVVAKYQGTPVKALQQLRKNAADEGSELHVIKNRLFKKQKPKLRRLANLRFYRPEFKARQLHIF